MRGAKDEAGCEERSDEDCDECKDRRDEAQRMLRFHCSPPSRLVASLLSTANTPATYFALRQNRSNTVNTTPLRLNSLVAGSSMC